VNVQHFRAPTRQTGIQVTALEECRTELSFVLVTYLDGLPVCRQVTDDPPKY